MKRIKTLAAVGFVGLIAITGCEKKAKTEVAPTAEATKPAEGGAAPVEAAKADTVAPDKVVAAAEQAPGAAAPAADPLAAPATPPAAGGSTITDAELEASIDKMFSMFEKMAEVAVKNQDDCAKAGAAIKAVIADNKAFLEEAKKLQNDPTIKDRAEKFVSGKADKMKDTMGKMMPVAMKCEKDPTFVEAMSSLQM